MTDSLKLTIAFRKLSKSQPTEHIHPYTLGLVAGVPRATASAWLNQTRGVPDPVIEAPLSLRPVSTQPDPPPANGMPRYINTANFWPCSDRFLRQWQAARDRRANQQP
jgi:hypothetical protein